MGHRTLPVIASPSLPPPGYKLELSLGKISK